MATDLPPSSPVDRRGAAPAVRPPARGRRLALVGVLVLALLVAVAVRIVEGRSDERRPVAEAWTLEPYQGVGAWVDAFDWSHAMGGEHPPVDQDAFRSMADEGIQTVFLQTSHLGVPDQVVLEKDRLTKLIHAAHQQGLSVVAWYLPTLEDVDVDLERLLASAKLDVDGLAVDIEATTVKDAGERNARLLDLTSRLRQALPDKAIGAITLSAVHLQEVNRDFWPDFPWADVARTYDVILPMAYWTIRLPEWRNGNRYVGENIDRIRTATGNPDVPIHVIGGLAEDATPDDLQGMLRAIQDRDGILGASLYDWATASPDQWAVLAPLADRNPAAAPTTGS